MPHKSTTGTQVEAGGLDPRQQERFEDLGGFAWLQGVLDSLAMSQVRGLHLGAFAHQQKDGSWHILSGADPGTILGKGNSDGEAWHSASKSGRPTDRLSGPRPP